VPKNLPKSTSNLPNRYKNLIGQKKFNFIWPFSKNKNAKGVQETQKSQIWPEKKSNWQPCPRLSVALLQKTL